MNYLGILNRFTRSLQSEGVSNEKNRIKLKFRLIFLTAGSLIQINKETNNKVANFRIIYLPTL